MSNKDSAHFRETGPNRSSGELGANESDFNGSFCDLSVGDLNDRAAEDARHRLANKETKVVSCLRLVVIMVLLATALGVSVGTYLFARRVEEEAFRHDFDSVAKTTLLSFVEAFENYLSALDSLSQGITSHALSTGSTFPNVTVDDFHVKAATMRAQTGSLYSFYLAFVTDETRAGYEQYCRNRQALDVFPPYLKEEEFRMYQDTYFGLVLSYIGQGSLTFRTCSVISAHGEAR